MGFLAAGSAVGVSAGSSVGVCVGAVGVTTAAWLIVSGPLLGVGAGAVVVATAADLFAAPDVSGLSGRVGVRAVDLGPWRWPCPRCPRDLLWVGDLEKDR